MAVTFPLSLTDFFETLDIDAGTQFYLPGSRVSSRTRGGEVISAVVGNSLWQGSVTVTGDCEDSILPVQAWLEMLDRTGGSFLVHALPACGPAFDRDGAIIAGHSPTVRSTAQDRSLVSVENLPTDPRYELNPGDLLSIAYGTDPVRYSMHRVLEFRRANPTTGQVSNFSINPPRPPGVQIGDPVTFYKPVIKAVLVPDSVRWPSYGPISRISFDFVQTFGE